MARKNLPDGEKRERKIEIVTDGLQRVAGLTTKLLQYRFRYIFKYRNTVRQERQFFQCENKIFTSSQGL